eukprot:m.12170 g.12170  ORF g.12170 m.12170 type:complete len:66 (+) comp23859_c0_seq1:294-491(+)
MCHSKPLSQADIEKALEELVNTAKAFTETDSRCHKSFTRVKGLLEYKIENLVKWMTGHLKVFTRN